MAGSLHKQTPAIVVSNKFDNIELMNNLKWSPLLVKVDLKNRPFESAIHPVYCKTNYFQDIYWTRVRKKREEFFMLFL